LFIGSSRQIVIQEGGPLRRLKAIQLADEYIELMEFLVVEHS
jgi:hypothetical protein